MESEEESVRIFKVLYKTSVHSQWLMEYRITGHLLCLVYDSNLPIGITSPSLAIGP